MNCIAIHKAQGLKIGLFLDDQFLLRGQAYVTLSRATCLDDVNILFFE